MNEAKTMRSHSTASDMNKRATEELVGIRTEMCIGLPTEMFRLKYR